MAGSSSRKFRVGVGVSGAPAPHGSDVLVREAVEHINRLVTGARSRALAVEVGRYVLATFFDDDADAFRTRGRQHATLGALAAHPDLGVTPIWLWRAVSIAVQHAELDPTVADRLSYSHHVALLPVPADRKAALASLAVERGWSRSRLLAEVARASERRGRAVVSGLRRMLAIVEDDGFEGLEGLDGLSEHEQADLLRMVRRGTALTLASWLAVVLTSTDDAGNEALTELLMSLVDSDGSCEDPDPPGDQLCNPDDDAPGKVTLCHIPPGNPAAAHTIRVGAAAVPAHLAHGDVLDVCPDCEEPEETGDTGDCGDDDDDDDDHGDDDDDHGDDDDDHGGGNGNGGTDAVPAQRVRSAPCRCLRSAAARPPAPEMALTPPSLRP